MPEVYVLQMVAAVVAMASLAWSMQFPVDDARRNRFWTISSMLITVPLFVTALLRYFGYDEAARSGSGFDVLIIALAIPWCGMMIFHLLRKR